MTPAWLVIATVVLPLWICAGFLDWLCHRFGGIERTETATVEARFHWLHFCLTGSIVIVAMALESSPAVFACLFSLWALHEISTWAELRVVAPHRPILPEEQMVHSLLEMLPLTLILLLAVGCIGDGCLSAGGGLKLRQSLPIPTSLAVALGAGIVALNVVPLLEELWRCQRGRNALLHN